MLISCVAKGTSVSEEKEFRQKIEHVTTDPSLLQTVKFEVAAYRGHGAPPEWVDEVSDRCKHPTSKRLDFNPIINLLKTL